MRWAYSVASCLVAALLVAAVAVDGAGATCMLGEVRAFAVADLPEGWIPCDGTALDAGDLRDLLFNRFGGSAPDLRGRALRGASVGEDIGTERGSESFLLSISMMPNHTHDVAFDNRYPASADDGMFEEPDNNFPAVHSAPFYSRDPPTVNMGGSDAMLSGTVLPSGAGEPVSLFQPSMALNLGICADGATDVQNTNVSRLVWAAAPVAAYNEANPAPTTNSPASAWQGVWIPADGRPLKVATFESFNDFVGRPWTPMSIAADVRAPNITGRLPIGTGHRYRVGDLAGSPVTSVNGSHLPSHTHGSTFSVALPVSNDAGLNDDPDGGFPAMALYDPLVYNPNPDASMGAGSLMLSCSLGNSGGGQGTDIETAQPSLDLTAMLTPLEAPVFVPPPPDAPPMDPPVVAEHYVGEIGFFLGDTVPEGWLVADGSAFDVDEYDDLAEAIGATFGEGLLPDLRGRTVVGSIPNTKFALGETGGREAEPLTVDHLPPHDHPVLSTYGYGRGVNEDPEFDEPENAYFAVNDRGYSPTPDAVAVAGVTATVSVSPDGEPVPIMQPSAAVTIAIRARPWDPPPSFFTPAVIVGAAVTVTAAAAGAAFCIFWRCCRTPKRKAVATQEVSDVDDDARSIIETEVGGTVMTPSEMSGPPPGGFGETLVITTNAAFDGGLSSDASAGIETTVVGGTGTPSELTTFIPPPPPVGVDTIVAQFSEPPPPASTLPTDIQSSSSLDGS